MKRQVKASAGGNTVLYAQYLSADDVATNDIGIRSMTVTRPTFNEAATVMLDHIELADLDLDYDEMGNYDREEIINAIMYANANTSEGDYILYLEDRSAKDVIIDENYPEENY